MNASSRGDLIDALINIQGVCTDALHIFPAEYDGQNVEVRALANMILNMIHGTVTVTKGNA